MKDIALHEGMGENIIRHLSQFADLPGQGLLAGQAVASAVSELYRDGSGVVYNDLDVFRQYQEDEESVARRMKREATRALATVSFNTVDVVQDGYGSLSFDLTSRYRVVKTSRDDLLNDVACEIHTDNPREILRTFDMNCVQVGVDLETKKLVWTPAFEEFDRTRQMEIAYLHTPMHSIIRYFKKRRELDGVFGNDERMLELVAAAYYAELDCQLENNPSLVEGSNVRWRFGPVYKARYDMAADQLSPYFDIVQEENMDMPIFSLKPKFEIDTELRKLGSSLQVGIHGLPTVSRMLREKHRKGMAERLAYLAKAPQPTTTYLGWHQRGNEYLKANVTPAEMERIDAMTSEHYLRPLFHDRPLAEQNELAKRIAAEVSRRGMWVYGVLENNQPSVITGKADWEESPNGLTELLDREAELLSKPLTAPILPPIHIGEYTVRDLVNGLEIRDEGDTMHHCVGGYAGAVGQGYCRIISFRNAGPVQQWLTMEVRRRTKGCWQVIQLRGLQNRAPTDMEKSVAAQYVGLLCLADWVGASAAQLLRQTFPKSVIQAGKLAVFLENLGDKQREALVPRFVRKWSLALSEKFLEGETYISPKNSYTMYHVERQPFKFWMTALRKKWALRNEPHQSLFEEEEIPF